MKHPSESLCKLMPLTSISVCYKRCIFFFSLARENESNDVYIMKVILPMNPPVQPDMDMYLNPGQWCASKIPFSCLAAPWISQREDNTAKAFESISRQITDNIETPCGCTPPLCLVMHMHWWCENVKPDISY